MIRGFSLLEVIIALAILALITVFVLPSLASFNATIDTTIKTVSDILYNYSYSSVSENKLLDISTITIYEKSTHAFTFLDYKIK